MTELVKEVYTLLINAGVNLLYLITMLFLAAFVLSGNFRRFVINRIPPLRDLCEPTKEEIAGDVLNQITKIRTRFKNAKRVLLARLELYKQKKAELEERIEELDTLLEKLASVDTSEARKKVRILKIKRDNLVKALKYLEREMERLQDELEKLEMEEAKLYGKMTIAEVKAQTWAYGPRDYQVTPQEESVLAQADLQLRLTHLPTVEEEAQRIIEGGDS